MYENCSVCIIVLICFDLQEKDCDICGVEITDDAVAVNQHPFTKSTAFLLGNEVVFALFAFCSELDFDLVYDFLSI